MGAKGPDELIPGNWRRNIPPIIFEVVNKMITEKWDGKKAVLLQPDIVDMAIYWGINITANDLFENHSLDFEDHYRDEGWNVTYYKPHYSDDDTPTFTFTKP
ncbi:MAG: hypothetical protein GY799_21225 [Desulfobulbaceae bacterium]|nr:hypothetical protein [Desulfobulbaceae bacterium]